MKTHRVYESVNALIRKTHRTITITPTVSYRVTAPSLLTQLKDELAASTTGTGGRTIPRSKILIAPDAYDLWETINKNTHEWAHQINVNCRPYITADPKTDPPPIGRLLNQVAHQAIAHGHTHLADTIANTANQWRTQIEAWLHGQTENRGIRGAQCPTCQATHITDNRPEGRIRIPAITLTRRTIAKEELRWLTCLACGWTHSLDDLARLRDILAASTMDAPQ